jgi:aromatic-L-amino-acid decarboxylase
MDGCDRADSLVINPHKWLFTPMDCSALYIRSPQTLRRAFSLVPDYLVTEGEVTNFMDWGVQLGRRFRALKLWMILRYFGREGLVELIRGHVALAQEFAVWVDASEDYVRTAPAPLSAVCFRAEPHSVVGEEKLEALNAALMQRINASGKIFLSHTKLKGLYTLRIAIGNIRTGPAQLQILKQLLAEELAALLQTGEFTSPDQVTAGSKI